MAAKVPNIVYEQEFVAENSSLGQLTIFTPLSSGLFRVSYYAKVVNGSGSALDLNVGWTDDSSNRGQGDTVGIGNFLEHSYIIRVISSTDITISANKNSSGFINYDLFVRVEEL